MQSTLLAIGSALLLLASSTEANFTTLALGEGNFSYELDGRCVSSPVCCCPTGAIIVSSAGMSGKVNIASSLSGGPECNFKKDVSGPFDVISNVKATFNEPGTPLLVTAQLSPDFSMISFSNNIQQCNSIGNLQKSKQGKAFSTFQVVQSSPHIEQPSVSTIQLNNNNINTNNNNNNNQPQILLVDKPQESTVNLTPTTGTTTTPPATAASETQPNRSRFFPRLFSFGQDPQQQQQQFNVQQFQPQGFFSQFF